MTTADLSMIISMVATIVLTIFAACTMYYLILILRRFHAMMDTLDSLLASLTDGLSEVYRKADILKNTIEVVSEGLKAVIGMYQGRIEKKRKK